MHFTTIRPRLGAFFAAAAVGAAFFSTTGHAQTTQQPPAVSTQPSTTSTPGQADQTAPSTSAVSIVTPVSVATATPVRPAVPLRVAVDVAPGETRLDGMPSTALDSTSGCFTMRVCSFAAGHGARVWLGGPRSKEVLTDAKTIFYSFGSSSSQVELEDVTSNSFHVTVIGTDQGDGKPVLARVVWVQKASPIETAFVKQAKSESSTGTVAPEIEALRPMVYTMGHYFPTCVVEAKLSTVQVRVGLAWRHVGATESLGGIVKDYGAIAGINGSFFDAYNHSAVKPPNNELICMSEPVYCSDIGTVLGFTPDGEARMAPSPVADALHRLDPVYAPGWNGDVDKALFWQRVTEGMGAGPRLVKDGEIDYEPYDEGFHSNEVLSGVSMRSAVGITSTGWLLLVTTRASMRQLAHIMRALGCSEAMNLDGGTSSGLWGNGHYLRRPGRQLSNALVILKR